MKFGEKVKKARQERKMTQKELAERAGISLRTVLNYEGGERLPKSRKVYASIADALGMDESVLIDDDAEFVLHASEEYGSRGAKQAEELVGRVLALYAGGELDEEDMDAMAAALQEAYWQAKKINRKYVPKKFLKDE